MPIGGRSTAIRLDDGGIFVYVSHPLTTATQEALKQLGGEVKWLVTPDGEHGMNVKAWSDAFPEAKWVAYRPADDAEPLACRGSPPRSRTLNGPALSSWETIQSMGLSLTFPCTTVGRA